MSVHRIFILLLIFFMVSSFKTLKNIYFFNLINSLKLQAFVQTAYLIIAFYYYYYWVCVSIYWKLLCVPTYA